MEIIEKALAQGRTQLSEYESKQVLAGYQIPVSREILVSDKNELVRAALDIGYPLVIKGCAPMLAHKTEQNLLRIDIRTESEAQTAFSEIISAIDGEPKQILVQEMVSGRRELVVGMTRDPQFGPCVMFGLGGIFTEILNDVVFRVAPLEKSDAIDMMHEIKGQKILESIRGMDPADLDQLSQIIIQVGNIGLENRAIKEIDINPLILSRGLGIAVDALIILEPPPSPQAK